MFLIYGTRTARIKKYLHEQQHCKACGGYDMQVKVYRKYYHAFFIPVLPVGDKHVEIRCNSCGTPMMLMTIKQHYEKTTRTPFYLYTAPILLACAILMGIYANINTQKEKKLFIAHPQVGDIYTIRTDEHQSRTYFFLRVIDIRGDTVVTCRNKMDYYRFARKLDDNDYFVTDKEILYTKEQLKQMLEKMIINAVKRDYDNDDGFNRIEQWRSE